MICRHAPARPLAQYVRAIGAGLLQGVAQVRGELLEVRRERVLQTLGQKLAVVEDVHDGERGRDEPRGLPGLRRVAREVKVEVLLELGEGRVLHEPQQHGPQRKGLDVRVQARGEDEHLVVAALLQQRVEVEAVHERGQDLLVLLVRLHQLHDPLRARDACRRHSEKERQSEKTKKKKKLKSSVKNKRREGDQAARQGGEQHTRPLSACLRLMRPVRVPRARASLRTYFWQRQLHELARVAVVAVGVPARERLLLARRERAGQPAAVGHQQLPAAREEARKRQDKQEREDGPIRQIACMCFVLCKTDHEKEKKGQKRLPVQGPTTKKKFKKIKIKIIKQHQLRSGRYGTKSGRRPRPRPRACTWPRAA